MIKIDSKLAKRVANLCSAGLCGGLGIPKPGKMCVEAAVSFALGEKHGDHPTCVDEQLADFKIGLNDNRNFKSAKQRGSFLKRIAIAQLGTFSDNYTFNYHKFTTHLAELWNKRLLKEVKAQIASAKSLDQIKDELENVSSVEPGWGLELPYTKDTTLLALYIEDAVQILKDLKTPGSKFLHLAKLPKEIKNYKRPK